MFSPKFRDHHCSSHGQRGRFADAAESLTSRCIVHCIMSTQRLIKAVNWSSLKASGALAQEQFWRVTISAA
jgi:hypothetical protein